MGWKRALRAVPGLRAARQTAREARVRSAALGWSARTAARRASARRVLGDVRPVAVGPHRLLGRAVDGYTAAGARDEDLVLVAGVLDAAGIPYFLVPGASPWRRVVGVERRHRPAFLAAAARELAGGCAYAGAVGAGDRVTAAALWADGRLPKGVRRADVLRVGTVRLGPAGQVLAGLDGGCDVEFWVRGEEAGDAARRADLWLSVPGGQLADAFPDALLAPRRNRVSEVVPAEAQKPGVVRIAGRAVDTFDAFAQPEADAVRFPIDVVYTWVDGEDEALAAKRAAHRGAAGGIAERETGMSRYTSHDELKYSLRSLEMYAPFVRHVYLVTDGQKPHWLDADAEGITVVDHRDIFPEDVLPVFNSHAIETRLHHIPGLSDHYLYFNDDVFVNRPVTAGHFFHGSGIAKVPFSPLKLGLGLPHPLEPAPNSAGKNVRRLMQQHHGRFITHKFLHTPHPQIRAVMREIAEAGFAELEDTVRSRFRATTDVATAATFHHYWATVTGRAVAGDYAFRYVDVGRADVRERLERLRAGEEVDFFCLNDVDTAGEGREAVHRTVRAFLEWKYPFRSRFERS
ncbi:stealth family protein [Streptomyces sp. TRM 70351]|uniref:stealth family protein n=1 Tax=Streptomyces sp. TRM 70351 TaxID=3116552 RepID=UPI002E7B57DB|nr:stealth family protein [Streptomyces sp. TRM 70351]MEE1926820.1 stealth family protein [Streptomyces sp. TRM 70351]